MTRNHDTFVVLRHRRPATRRRSGGDIDHLLIGQGGVFTINAKNHEGKSVWIDL
ncbi:nuclease-related domain-containing protein [Streptomyces sp. NPDC102384]|uniref:nuclease-related domain-containing protein n=1 Tax=Streptomyces sp. NPDC102384 TaxID=3366166 RepID=UPI0037FBC2B0